MRSIGIAQAVIGLGALSALAHAQGNGGAYTQYLLKLSRAKTLTVEYTTSVDGGAPSSYSISLAKPNLARLDSPDTLIILDGANETTYYKKQGVYLVHPQLDSVVRTLFQTDELALFTPFFDASLLRQSSVVDGGATSLEGKDYLTMTTTLPGSKHSAVAWIGKDDSLVQRATITGFFDSTHTDQHKLQKCQLETKSVMVSGSSDASLYQFKPPKDARMMTLADLPSDTWFTDLSLAAATAAQTNRRVFVDFMASWCGPCHQLHDQVLVTDDFNRLSKYFVFLQIDVDEQKSLTQSYQITAMPTQMILDQQGAVIGKTVGYGGPQSFFRFLSKYVPG